MRARAWTERRNWWLPPLVALGVGLLALSWYLVVYSGFAASVDQQLERRERTLDRLESLAAARRLAAERLRYNTSELESFYEARLAPPSERLTRVIREVRTLARTAGLEPSAIAYPEDELAEYGLVKRGFSFAVRGSYEQLRRFINLLEMTDSFLTLEGIQLTGRGDRSELRISLDLSTLFTQDEEPADSGEAAS